MALTKETPQQSNTTGSESAPVCHLFGWFRLQRSLAEQTGLALGTFESDGSVIGKIENDNSICQAMMSSPEHARLCATDCGRAFSGTIEAGEKIEFKCHAGLVCFAAPIHIDGAPLVVLGGRAFTSTSEYRNLARNYPSLFTHETHILSNVKFCGADELRDQARLVAVAAASFAAHSSASESSSLRRLLDAHRFSERKGKLEIVKVEEPPKARERAEDFYGVFHEVAATLEPREVYDGILSKVSEIMKARRSSLMILNEQANELSVEAALGFNHERGGPVRVKLGDQIAGAVLERSKPIVVTDAERDERIPRHRRGNYDTKSFISFPIVIGARKLGVINLTHRVDGLEYSKEDLGLIEMMAPHLALLIDRAEWHKKAEQFQQMSLTDALTGLPNRRYLEDRLFEEVERSKRHNTPLSFMIIDIDWFKKYNDVYGHTNADRMLIKTAQTLRRCVRAIDMSARFAGDEFCIVLPETEIGDAAVIAERLRAEVSNIDFRSEQGEPMGRVTISIGLSSFSASRQSPLAIIETADRALYGAKTHGRNCVVSYDEIADR
jgi:diguanylate cyclase (GGDEF)-like protein